MSEKVVANRAEKFWSAAMGFEAEAAAKESAIICKRRVEYMSIRIWSSL
jgi:hypothetical protein